MPGSIDPASRGRSQVDGRQLLQSSWVETGLYRVLQRLGAGRLKVFKSLSQWLAEFRLYRRDEKGKVVKERDHGMDATFYGLPISER